MERVAELASVTPVSEVPLGRLSPREKEVLALAAAGYLDKQIGAELGVSLNTLRTFWSRIRSKAGDVPRTALVTAYLNERLRDLGLGETVGNLLHPASGTAPSAVAVVEIDTPKHNIPYPTSSFVGRNKELADVRALLRSNRLVTLTGFGGNGKTRLALKACEGLLSQYRDGLWVIELAAVTDPQLIAQAVATVLGITERQGQPIENTTLEWLAAKRLLLVLDNCEHLVEGCAQFCSKVLAGCPNVEIFASSRERLGIEGEAIYVVPPFRVPERDADQSLKAIREIDAVRLFVERASLVDHGFELTEQNAATIASICRRLDGIPLAIELAAARLRAMSVDTLNGRLHDRFSLLTGGSRGSPQRHQTLRDLIDWSVALLSEPERALLRRLSIFDGGWTLESAEQVCAGDEVGTNDVMRLLTGLTDKSLVIFDSRGSADRYMLLRTIRKYGEECLRDSNEYGKVNDRYVSCFVELAEQASPYLEGRDQQSWFNRLESEHDNIRGVLRLSDSTSDDSGIRICGAIWRFWSVRGYVAEGRRRCEAALSHSDGGHLDGPVLFGSASLAWAQGDLERAGLQYEAALALARRDGDRALEANVLNGLGIVASVHADFSNAREYYLRSLEINRELQNKVGEVRNLNNLGNLAESETGFRDEKRFLVEALAINRELGNRLGVAINLGNLGTIALEAGDLDSATKSFEESMMIARELGNLRVEAIALTNLGDIACHRKDMLIAQVLYRRAFEVYRECGPELYAINCLEGQFVVCASLGSLTRAMTLWSAAESLRASYNSPLPTRTLERYRVVVNSVRERMGEESYSAAHSEGPALTMPQAIDYALKIRH